MFTLTLSKEQRDVVVQALLQDARVEFEGGENGPVATWLVLDSVNDILDQLGASLIPLPPLEGVDVDSLGNALSGFDWTL